MNTNFTVGQRTREKYRHQRKLNLAKIRRLEKKGINLRDADEDAFYKLTQSIDEFSSRKEFNQWVKQSERFRNRNVSDYQVTENVHGTPFLKKEVRQATEMRERQIERFTKFKEKMQELTAYGDKQKYGTVSQQPTLDTMHVPKPFDIDQFEHREVFEHDVSMMEVSEMEMETRKREKAREIELRKDAEQWYKQEYESFDIPDDVVDMYKRNNGGEVDMSKVDWSSLEDDINFFVDKRLETMKENYMEILRLSFHSQADELLDIIENVPPALFYGIYLSYFAEMNFDLFDSEGETVDATDSTLERIKTNIEEFYQDYKKDNLEHPNFR